MADPITAAITAIGAAIGGTAGAAMIMYAGELAIATLVVGSASLTNYQRNRAKAKARAAYNASLKDRELMIRSAVAPRTYTYGTDKVSGPLVFAHTSGANKEFLHLVIAVNARRINRFVEFWFNDVKLPDPDANGFITSGEFGNGTGNRRTESIGAGRVADDGTYAIPADVTQVVSVNFDYPDDRGLVSGWTHVAGSTVITGLPPGAPIEVTAERVEFDPVVRILTRTGAPGQTAYAELIEESDGKWTAAHRGEGIAHVYIRLKYVQDVFGQIGLPNFSAVIEGAQVEDPRTSTVIFSPNSALVVADWLKAGHGLAASDEEVPESELIAEANICDESVTLVDMPPGVPDITQRRYEFNGTFTSDETPLDVLGQILESMAGSCVYTQGRWLLAAGAYRAPAVTLGPDDLAGSGVSIVPKASRSELFNAVRVTYRDPGQKWAQVQAPLITNPQYEAEDGGRRKVRNIEFAFAMDTWRAQRLGKIELERGRQALTVQLATNMRGYDLMPTRTANLQLPRYGWGGGKAFECRQRTLGADGSLQYMLRETAPGIFAWNLGEATVGDLAPDTDLPNPYLPPAQLTITNVASGTEQLLLMGDGSIVPRVLIEWHRSTDVFVLRGGHIEVEYTSDGAVDWQPTPPVAGDANSAYVVGLQDGRTALLRIRAVNSAGRASLWSYQAHVVEGKSLPPRDVPSVNYEITNEGVLISVPENADLDRDVTELRVGGLDWATAVPLVGTQPTRFAGTTYLWPRPAPGIYRVRARYVDTSGNLSANATYVDAVVTAADAVEWAEVGGRPRTWRVGAVGFVVSGSTIGPGFFNGETGAQIGAYARSWMLMAIRRDDDQVVFGPQYYDVMSEGTDPETPLGYGRGSLALAADLNALGNNVWAVVTTYDEPATNRLSGGLPAALKRIGARQATLDAIGYRGAYVCVGVPGVGEGGAIFEGVRNGATAWIDMSFQTFKGQVLGVSAADGGVNSALALAASAKSTADGKIDTFYQDDPPPTAGEGDLWFDTNDGRKLYVRSAFGSWVPADDVRIGNAVTAAAGAQATADGKVTTFYASSAPGAGAVGDLWFNTSNGRSYRWNGGAWLLVTTVGAGDITTALLADEAATSIYPMSFVDSHIWDAPNTTTWPRAVIGTLTFVAPATGPALVTADVVTHTTMPTSGAVPTYAYHVINTAWLVNGSYTGGAKRYHGPDSDMFPGGEYWLSFVRTLDINVTAGVSYTVQLTAEATTTTIDSLTIDNRASGRLRLEMIKK